METLIRCHILCIWSGSALFAKYAFGVKKHPINHEYLDHLFSAPKTHFYMHSHYLFHKFPYIVNVKTEISLYPNPQPPSQTPLPVSHYFFIFGIYMYIMASWHFLWLFQDSITYKIINTPYICDTSRNN